MEKAQTSSWQALVRRFVLGLAGVLIIALAPAQQPRTYMEAVPSDGAIKIRWLTSELPQGGYVLERRAAGAGEYQPLPNTPLQPNWTPDAWRGAFGVFFPQALTTVGVERTEDFFNRLRTQSPSRVALGLISISACQLMGWYYEDKSVQAGQRYDYRLVAGGQTLATVEGVQAGATPAIPKPPKPTVKAEKGQVEIRWTFPNDPQLYGVIVERSERADGGFEPIRPFISVNGFWLQQKSRSSERVSGDTMIVEVPPQQNRVYYYRLVAVDFVGNRGEASEAVAFQVPFLNPPEPARNVSAELTPDGKVVIRWEPSPSEQTVGYRIYRGEALGDDANERLTPQNLPKDARQFTTEQPAGTARWYAVVAVDPFDQESQRTSGAYIKIPDTTAPQPPSGGQATLETPPATQQEQPAPLRKIVLTWQANKETDLLGYHVQRGFSPDGPYLTITNEPLRETRYEIALKPEEEGDLYFRLQAIDFDQNLSLPSQPIKISLPNVQPPDPPALLSVTAEGNLSLVLKWRPSTAPDLQGYLIERRVDGGAWEPLNDGQLYDKNLNTLTETNLMGGLTYEYRLTAVDTAGNRSVPSEPMGGVPRDTEPPQPPKAFNARVEPGAGGVMLSWEPSPSNDVAHYRLFRAEGETGGAFAPISADIDSKTTRALDTGALPGKTYRYQIIAVDFAGNQSQPLTTRAIKIPQ